MSQSAQIDPNLIPESDLPLIVFSDHSSGFIQWLIKWRTKANYNHVMVMHKPGMFASQGNVFSEIPLSRYMTANSRLKFWKVRNLGDNERKTMLDRIDYQLRQPWHKRAYDYLGIFGQALSRTGINHPGKMYCSERVADLMTVCLASIPDHPSPKDLNTFFKSNDRMEVYGRWSAD